MTANSLASVSLHPPLISICVEHQAEMHEVMEQADRFALNILGTHQETLSRRFAGHHEGDRFAGIGYTVSAAGLIVLDGALAHIECERHAQFPLGDHTLFVGRVTGGGTADLEDRGHGHPLLYYRGGYAGLDVG
jgi:flavin reductase (DIM6/NTAB) family NADH-FMN oxidoreductase RutF